MTPVPPMTPLNMLYGLLGIAIPGLLTYLAARLTRRTAQEQANQTGAFTMIDKLDKRVADLEKKVTGLEAELDLRNRQFRAASLFIDRVGLWHENGSPANRRPFPPRLIHEFIELGLWGEDPGEDLHHEPHDDDPDDPKDDSR